MSDSDLALASPHRWQIDVHDADVAVLNVPPVSGGPRQLDVDVQFVVQVPTQGGPHWLELTVELDGRRQWSRRIDASPLADTDSLDYNVRVEVAAATGLRIRALTEVCGARRKRLLIEAAEILAGSFPTRP
jgi:hypothetical protein